MYIGKVCAHNLQNQDQCSELKNKIRLQIIARSMHIDRWSNLSQLVFLLNSTLTVVSSE